MLFNSISFLIFFPVVILLYFIIPHRFRYIWLLAASYYFYMAWNPVYALLMLTPLISINILLSALHIQLIQPKFDIILPLGISFYTMQMIAYIVDIYRGAKAETNFIKYALFISFFPKLLAGPIF